MPPTTESLRRNSLDKTLGKYGGIVNFARYIRVIGVIRGRTGESLCKRRWRLKTSS